MGMLKSAWAWAALIAIGAATSAVGAVPAPGAGPDSTNGWGYGYDSLLRDLGVWKQSPHVRVDSIGSSVQKRALWMVSITEAGDSVGRGGDLTPRKHRVFMHARTHPAEVQAHYVANEAIKFLLADNEQAAKLRRDYIFNFIPMYNPDGVELGKARQNAHDSDLESNWDAKPMEPEPTALKATFVALMAGPIPIEVALNLHSDQYNHSRFFFYHYPAGTSERYSDLEKGFIAAVQAWFPGGIKNWDMTRSWANGTVTHYPEGFWWVNHKEKVMALTFEDNNTPGSGGFDSTAKALVLGSTDYIKAGGYAGVLARPAGETRMLLVSEGVRIRGDGTASRWELFDSQGRTMASGLVAASGALLPWSSLPSAPLRILSVSRRSGARERISLPAFPR